MIPSLDRTIAVDMTPYRSMFDTQERSIVIKPVLSSTLVQLEAPLFILRIFWTVILNQHRYTHRYLPR